MNRRPLDCMLLLAWALLPLAARAQSEPVSLPSLGIERAQAWEAMYGPMPNETDNHVLWQQYQALNSPTYSADGCPCGAAGYGDRCGCNQHLFPWFRGSGSFDQWCVGPHWQVSSDGLILFRDDAGWAAFQAAVPAAQVLDDFDHGIGGRVFVTGYNERGFGMQIGWEGVQSFEASAVNPIAADEFQRFDYSSQINSVEVNFLPNVPYAWRLYTGIRFLQIDEGFTEFTTQIKPIPAPVSMPAGPTADYDEMGSERLLLNRLIGFQLGGRRDTWNLGRWLSLDAFTNAGVYCNAFRRDDLLIEVHTEAYPDDEDTQGVNENEFVVTKKVDRTRTRVADMAFVAEAGLTGVIRVNQSLAIRGGYQVLVVDGAAGALAAAIDASAAAFVPQFEPDTLVYHGLQFGIEYRR